MSTQEVQAAPRLSVEISDIQYDIAGAFVHPAPPHVGRPVASVTNDSDTILLETVGYTYDKTPVGTWNNADGSKLGDGATFTAGVPYSVNAKLELDVTDPGLHTFGGNQGVVETVHDTTTVTVPPRKRAIVTLTTFIREIRSVPFTYRQRICWESGRVEDNVKNGVYSNSDTWATEIKVKLEDI